MENSFRSLNSSRTSSHGALGRFQSQRKALSDSMNQSALSQSSNQSINSSVNVSKSKTPGSKGTPGRKGGGQVADRFIPDRQASNFELGYFRHCVEGEAGAGAEQSGKADQMMELMSGVARDAKIFSYTHKPPKAPEGHANQMQVLFSSKKENASTTKSQRHIPKTPDRILDAPAIVDDYYLNLLDWSETNLLAVALGPSVYLWDPVSGGTTIVTELETPDAYVCSLSWVKQGNILAIGQSNGATELWDVGRQKRLRVIGGHTSRVSSLSWNTHLLSSGSQTGVIHHHDVRVSQHHIGTLNSHSQEVCGLSWSPDGRYLASGGNDNALNIWPNSTAVSTSEPQPLATFTQHQAAVKALAWCPWQPSVLASGGGTADRHIRLWNVTSSCLVKAVDTGSQVCGLLWCPHYRELISGHGYAQHQLTIWNYPDMERVTELTGHTQRILHMAMSPDHQMVMTASADETLRLWKCFAADPKVMKKETSVGPAARSLSSFHHIR